MPRLSRRAVVASLAVPALATAGWAPKPDPTLAPRPPGPDEALLYIYRMPGEQYDGAGITVLIDKVKSVNLAPQDYSWMYVKARDYHFSVTGSFGMTRMSSPKAPRLTFAGGQTYYLKVRIDPTPPKFFVVDQVPAATGFPAIRGDFKRGAGAYRLRPPEPAISELGATDH